MDYAITNKGRGAVIQMGLLVARHHLGVLMDGWMDGGFKVSIDFFWIRLFGIPLHPWTREMP